MTSISLFLNYLLSIKLFVYLPRRWLSSIFQAEACRDKLFFFPDLYFRSMKKNTPNVATHLLENPGQYLLKIGGILRKLSLDELPNLINIMRGEMVFVGPRPALYNQDDLMALRVAVGVDQLKPGITGWAQVNGRDEISIEEKVRLEEEYLRRRFCGLILGL
jgi:O-antigen biosynthesis protein WbqP